MSAKSTQSAQVVPIGTGYSIPPVRRRGGRAKLPAGVIDFGKAKIPHQRERMKRTLEAAVEADFDRRQEERGQATEEAYQSLMEHLVDTHMRQWNGFQGSVRKYVANMSIERWVRIHVDHFNEKPRPITKGLTEQQKSEHPSAA